MLNPAIKLFGFQKRWLEDDSRFKIGCICRQAGKSFMTSLEAVSDAVATKQNWVLLSAGERQSRELMEKVRMHIEAFTFAAASIEESFFNDTQTQQLSVRLPNNARIIGLPANPNTARGFSANVLLDEFAFHRDSSAIWTALFPTISRGYKLRVVSTPQGKSNRFYNLFSGSDNDFSKHFIDIYQAVEDGVPHNIEELKKGLDDEDAWQQEYLCQFMDEVSAFLTYELIASCEDEKLKDEIDWQDYDDSYFGDIKGNVYIGVDVGRKRDLTDIWVLEQLGDVLWTRGNVTMRNVKYAQQKMFILHLFRKLNATRGCGDSTGLGDQLCEELADELGSSKFEKVTFTNAVKNDIATRVLRSFQDRTVRIPVSKKIRNDLHSIKKTATTAGNVRFDAERTKDGHADRFWALGLAEMATDKGIKPEIFWI